MRLGVLQKTQAESRLTTTIDGKDRRGSLRFVARSLTIALHRRRRSRSQSSGNKGCEKRVDEHSEDDETLRDAVLEVMCFKAVRDLKKYKRGNGTVASSLESKGSDSKS
mgnify:CR=1 FL=1